MNKIINCFIDVETTGLLPYRNGVIEIAGSIEVYNHGSAEDSQTDFCFETGVFPDDVIDERALEVNKTTREEIINRKDPILIHKMVTTTFSKFVKKFNKTDKMFFIGYNASFDYDFLRNWFKKCGDKYMGSYFWFPYIDVMTLAAEHLKEDRHKIPNFRLSTVAHWLGINVDESKLHEASYDIELTKRIYHMVTGHLTEEEESL